MQLLEKADIPEQEKKTIYGCMVQPFPEDFLLGMAGHFGEDADTTTNDAMNAQGGELHGWDVRDKQGDIDVPTLVINGARDFAQDWIVAPFPYANLGGARQVQPDVAEYLGYN
ncbi:hypothetical protein GGF50DRAFT_117652 [Schizophyllum commune]